MFSLHQINITLTSTDRGPWMVDAENFVRIQSRRCSGGHGSHHVFSFHLDDPTIAAHIAACPEDRATCISGSPQGAIISLSKLAIPKSLLPKQLCLCYV